MRVIPRARAAQVEGVDDDGRLRVRVTSPPVEGAANAAVIKLLAAELGVPRSAVAIERGQIARVKLVSIDGISRQALLSRWPRLGLDGRLGGENQDGGR